MPLSYSWQLPVSGLAVTGISSQDDTEATTNQRYVRQDATGADTGLDWVNAVTALPASLSRDTTYWIADGTYSGGNNLNTANSGALTIRIKKATALLHGTDTGWSSLYGDGQAEFAAGFTFSTDNWIVDGTTGGGPGQWETGFGFYFNMPASGAQDHLFGFGSSVANITVKHCDTFGRGRTYAGGETDIFYLVTTIDNLKIQYNLLRDVNRTMILSWPADATNLLVEYNKFARNGPEEHREMWSAGSGTQNVIFRYNLCEDILGTGFIALVNNSGTCDDWGIYGNIFYHTGSYPVGGSLNTGVILTDSDTYNPGNPGDNIVPTNWRVYNNIIANIRNGSFTDAIWFRNTGTNTVVRNNIFYNNQCTDFQGVIGASDNDYNWHYNNTGGNGTLGSNDVVGSASPFTSATPWTSGDWSLSAAVDGQALADPYNVDMLGVTRGADGVFDRGALEYVASGGWTAPTPPTTTSDKYVRQGATGTASGNDWTNAYTTLPATLARDTTYWIADGTYAGYTFNDATSGTQYIVVRKATQASHGTDTGWLTTYGDGVAEFFDAGAGAWSFTTGYWWIDGITGSGSSGYGFEVHCGDNTGSDLITIDNVNSVNLLHINAYQQVFGGAEGNLNDVIYAISGGSNLYIGYCYFHDTNWYACMKMQGTWTNVTVESCNFARNYRKEIGRLSDVSNLIWRNNFHKEAAGTGYLVLDGVDGAQIYNNVFVVTDSNYTTTDCVVCNLYNQGMTASNVAVHHNTFVGCLGETMIGFDSATNITAYGNLFYNCENVGWHGTITHDYNWAYPTTSSVSGEAHGQIGSGDPFVDSAADDYHLVSHTTAGNTLSSPYDVDKDGVTRTTFDRGAYEKV